MADRGIAAASSGAGRQAGYTSHTLPVAVGVPSAPPPSFLASLAGSQKQYTGSRSNPLALLQPSQLFSPDAGFVFESQTASAAATPRTVTESLGGEASSALLSPQVRAGCLPPARLHICFAQCVGGVTEHHGRQAARCCCHSDSQSMVDYLWSGQNLWCAMASCFGAPWRLKPNGQGHRGPAISLTASVPTSLCPSAAERH